MKSMPWFRMYSDFIFDEKIEFLAFEDQRHFVFVLCMKNLGLIDKEYPQQGMLDRVIAKRLGLYGEAFENAKIRLVDSGLIDEQWQPCAWGKRQFRSDADATATERKRKQRERQRQDHKDVTRDASVTSRECHADVTRTDTDTDTDVNVANATSVAADSGESPSAAKQPAKKPVACPADAIVALYHELMPDNPRCKVLNDARRGAIRARWKEAAKLDCKPFGYDNREDGLSAWRAFFEVCADSPFLTGKAQPLPGKPPFVADIDFLMSPTGFARTIENKYHRGGV